MTDISGGTKGIPPTAGVFPVPPKQASQPERHEATGTQPVDSDSILELSEDGLSASRTQSFDPLTPSADIATNVDGKVSAEAVSLNNGAEGRAEASTRALREKVPLFQNGINGSKVSDATGL